MYAAEIKLNMESIAVPRAFFGKSKDEDVKRGSKSFRRADSGRFTGSEILQLALMNTGDVMFGGFSKITYSTVMDELRLSRPTVCKNFKALVASAVVKRGESRSEYEIKAKHDNKSNIPVYTFLLKEELCLGGRVNKRLSRNAVLYLSELIAHYLNPKNDGKYFIGGNSRVASTLNCAGSTAWYVIDELVSVGAIERLAVRDVVKSAEVNKELPEGAGRSRSLLTAYTVNGNILDRCRAIKKRREELKTVKKLFGQSRTRGSGRKTVPDKRYKDVGGGRGKYALAEYDGTAEPDFSEILKTFEKDVTLINLRKRHREIRLRLISELRGGNMNPSSEEELDSLLDDIRNYFIKRGVSPGIIPPDLGKYI